MRVDQRPGNGGPNRPPISIDFGRPASLPVERSTSRASMTSIERQVLLAILYFAAEYGNRASKLMSLNAARTTIIPSSTSVYADRAQPSVFLVQSPFRFSRLNEKTGHLCVFARLVHVLVHVERKGKRNVSRKLGKIFELLGLYSYSLDDTFQVIKCTN
jgi:hypothetical protein